MAKLNEKQVIALRKRYAFWQGKFNAAAEGANEADLETAGTQISKIEAEAKENGVDLSQVDAQEVPPQPNTNVSEVAAPAAPKTKSKSVAGAAKVQERAAALAAEKAAKAANGGTPGATRTKKEKVLRPCLDGCGEQVPGNFKMGHDAKLKSMILKIERGEMDMNELPEIAQELVGFKKGEKEVTTSKDGKTKETTQLYTVIKAPVRFQGRPEVQLTQRG